MTATTAPNRPASKPGRANFRSVLWAEWIKFRTVRSTDQFCTCCGHELITDQTPARLRVLSE